MFLLFFLGVLCYFSWKNWIKIFVCSFVLICVRFVVFSAFRVRCSFQFCVMCLWYLMCMSVWYFAILLSWILDANYAIFYWFVKFDLWVLFCDFFYLFVKFDLWLLFCDISICLLNLIFDYYFVIIPCFFCFFRSIWFLTLILCYFAILFNLILDINFVLFCNLVQFDSWH